MPQVAGGFWERAAPKLALRLSGTYIGMCRPEEISVIHLVLESGPDDCLNVCVSASGAMPGTSRCRGSLSVVLDRSDDQTVIRVGSFAEVLLQRQSQQRHPVQEVQRRLGSSLEDLVFRI